MAGLNKLLQPRAEQLITLVHLGKPRLVLAKRDVELVHRLRRTRAHRDEWRGVVQWAHSYCVLLLLNLGGEEPDTARHFVDAANLADERALERVYIRV